MEDFNESNDLAPLPETDDLALSVNVPPLDIDAIALNNVSIDDLETERVAIPHFGKHRKNTFYQRHPDEAWSNKPFGCLEHGMGETYVLNPSLVAPLLEHGATKRRVYTLIDREGDILFAAYKLPDENHELDSWNKSIHRILSEDWATSTWFKLISVKKGGKYVGRRAMANDLPSPDWPQDKTFQELFREAVQDRFIGSMDHPVVRSILGRE